jgi:hypothetical protein
MRQLALIRDYDALHRALKNRIAEFGTTMETIDGVAGFPARYTSKLLAPSKMKILGLISLGPILGAAGCCLILVEDPEQLARVRHRLTPRKLGKPGLPKKTAVRHRARTVAARDLEAQNATRRLSDKIAILKTKSPAVDRG